MAILAQKDPLGSLEGLSPVCSASKLSTCELNTRIALLLSAVPALHGDPKQSQVHNNGSLCNSCPYLTVLKRSLICYEPHTLEYSSL